MQRISLIGLTIISCAMVVACARGSEQNPPTEQVRTAGRLDAVTVYRGQALVTRAVDLDVGQGIHEVIVTDLPRHVVTGSLHAEGSAGVTVRSVHYREQPVRADVSEEAEALKKLLDAAKEELTRLGVRRETIKKHEAYLDKLQEFTSGSATGDLSRGVLDAAALKELSDYLYNERKSAAEESLELHLAMVKAEAEIAHLTREQQALGARSTHTAREASVFVEVPRGTRNPSFQLRYLVDGATWTPSYTIRGDIPNAQVLIEYFASIQQRSGEDWNNVEMTLSTATPSLVARAPRLTALAVALQPAGMRAVAGGQTRDDLVAQRRTTDHLRQNIGVSENWSKALAEADYTLNVVADQLQFMEFAGDPAATAPVNAAAEEGHSVIYRIAGRTSLPSRPERQHIQIASTPMEGNFYRLAVPVLTGYVYTEAHVTNTGDHVLLSGPVSTYANGQFVGHSELEDLSVGEPAHIGFGINSMLRSDRQLIKQDSRVQAGNRIVDLTYRLTVHNFGNEAASVLLMDRVPQAKPGEIRLTIVDDGTASSGVTSHEYNEEQGILRWDVEVPPRDTQPGTLEVVYSIRLEYDRQMTIAGAMP